MIKTLTLSQFLPVRQQGGATRVRSRVITTVKASTPAKPSTRSSTFNWIAAVSALLLFVNFSLVALHVVTANAYAVKGYEVTKLRQRTQELAEKNKKLMLESAEIASIAEVQGKATASNFVPVTTAEFLRPQTTTHVSQK